MEASPEILSGLLIASVSLIRFSRSRFGKQQFANEADKIVHELEAGVCPNCASVHPEATRHTGPDGFWLNFKCPECEYTMNAHVHHAKPIDA